MRLILSLLLMLLMISGCADKVEIDVRVVRLDEATALASTDLASTAIPSATTAPTLTPDQPPDTTLDAPPLTVDAPSNFPTSGVRPFFTFDPPNAQPPPTGLSSFPPGYTPESFPPTQTPPQQFDQPPVRTASAETLTPLDTTSVCAAYNEADRPLYLRERGDITSDIVGVWLPNAAAVAIGRNAEWWVYLQLPDGGTGWLTGEFVRIEGRCGALTEPNIRTSIPLDAACRVSSATGGRVELFPAPGPGLGAVEELPNTVLIGAVARSANGWLYVRDERGQLPRGRGDGWVFEANLNLNGDCDSLPIVAYGGMMTTLTPVPLIVTPSPDVCSIVNRSATRIMIQSGTRVDSLFLAWLEPGEAVQVIIRSPNNWFLVKFFDQAGSDQEGYIDGGLAELYGDCLGIAIPSDNYDPPAVLSPDLYRDCRFVPLVENAIADIGSLRAPLDRAVEYPIVRRRAGRYLILIAEGIGGWVAESVGMVRGDCERVGIPTGET